MAGPCRGTGAAITPRRCARARGRGSSARARPCFAREDTRAALPRQRGLVGSGRAGRGARRVQLTGTRDANRMPRMRGGLRHPGPRAARARARRAMRGLRGPGSCARGGRTDRRRPGALNRTPWRWPGAGRWPIRAIWPPDRPQDMTRVDGRRPPPLARPGARPPGRTRYPAQRGRIVLETARSRTPNLYGDAALYAPVIARLDPATADGANAAPPSGGSRRCGRTATMGWWKTRARRSVTRARRCWVRRAGQAAPGRTAATCRCASAPPSGPGGAAPAAGRVPVGVRVTAGLCCAALGLYLLAAGRAAQTGCPSRVRSAHTATGCRPRSGCAASPPGTAPEASSRETCESLQEPCPRAAAAGPRCIAADSAHVPHRDCAAHRASPLSVRQFASGRPVAL